MHDARNGAESLVHTLLQGGVDVCFTNPGTSEMHFVAALDRIPGMRCVLGLFEGVVTGAADGYYRIAGRPASTLLHLGPGLANGLANLHNARKAGSGIVNVVGEHATDHVALDAPLTSDIEGIARPMSHWVHTSRSADDIAADGARAVLEANAPPGRIATLVLPADTAWNPVSGGARGAGAGEAAGSGRSAAAPGGAPQSGPQALAEARRRRPADERAVREAAQALQAGEPALLLLGGVALQPAALELAGRIAARTGCALMSEFYTARLARGAGRVIAPRLPYAVEPALAALAPFRRIVMVGTKRPVAFFAYPGKPGLLAPPQAQLVTLAEVDQDLDGALAALAEALGASRTPPAGVAERAPRPDGAAAFTGALSPEGIGAVLAAHLPEQAIVVDEGVTTGRGLGPATVRAAPHDWLTGMGGAIGFGLPTAAGAAIAAPERKVIALEGDGSAMYTPQALWTIARENLDVTVLVFANRAYQILRGEFAGVGAGAPGPRATDMLTLDRPALDWCALARGMGVEAVRAEDLGALDAALRNAMARRGPALIEVVL